ncbi:MAG TPA: sulfite exporter TauE/SafE family protein [Acidimicrobiales bacterium]
MSLDLGEALLVAGAGFLAGGVNAVAGGGSLISFPALLAVGYPSVTANVTNTVSILPGYVGGAYGYRRELRGQGDRLRRLAPVSVLGAAAGATLLLTTSSDVFDLVVPFLVALASVLLLAQPRIQQWVLSRPHDGFARSRGALALTAFAAAVYGGYFGGGLGVILLAVLGMFLAGDLQHTNALKSALTLVINLVAMVAFALFGPVQWVAVAIVAPASLVGGWVGAQVARRLRADVLRATVAAFGFAVAVVLLVR